MFLLFIPHRLMTLFFTLCLLSVFTENANAQKLPTTGQIVVDAGSSKTRGILYELSSNGIIPIAEYSVKTPLSNYSSNAEEAATQLITPLLKELLTLANNKNYKFDKSKVSVHVLGTAGMRGLSTSQQASIYQFTTIAIKGQGLIAGQVRTLEGWEEGVFAWAHLNYLKKRAGMDNTLGIIEIGGASSQITFANKDSQNNNAHTVRWHGKTYHVLSESLLGLGANEARIAMNKTQQEQSCYPKGFSTSGAFNFAACDDIYNKTITDDTTEIRKLEHIVNASNYSQTEFVGLSALYYTLNFFNNDTPTRRRLKTALVQDCQNAESIENSIKQDDTKDKYQPENKCANGVFVYNFLYDHLNLQDGQITAFKKIEHTDIRWTDGFLLIDSER